MTLLAIFLSDCQITRIDIAGTALMGIVMMEGAFERDITRAVHLSHRRLAAFEEVDNDIAGTTHRQVGIDDIGLSDIDIAGANQHSR